jgi:hypothetical protein
MKEPGEHWLKRIEDKVGNVVPAELYERVCNQKDDLLRERDKKIAELTNRANLLESELCTSGIPPHPKLDHAPQPAREGWYWPVPAVILSGVIGVILGFCIRGAFIHPAAPKGTGDVTYGFQGGAVSGREQALSEENYGLRLERNHWLKNDRAAWRALDCGAKGRIYIDDEQPVINMIEQACKALDQ